MVVIGCFIIIHIRALYHFNKTYIQRYVTLNTLPYYRTSPLKSETSILLTEHFNAGLLAALPRPDGVGCTAGVTSFISPLQPSQEQSSPGRRATHRCVHVRAFDVTVPGVRRRRRFSSSITRYLQAVADLHPGMHWLNTWFPWTIWKFTVVSVPHASIWEGQP